MPTYVYKRKNGTTFEVVQSMKEEPLTEDEKGNPVERVLQPFSFSFQGGKPSSQ